MNDYKEIPLKGKNGEGLFTKVSFEDYEELNQWNWYLDERGYVLGIIYTDRVRNNKNRKNISMHRYIMNPPKNKFVDHINGDRLDNRRENLRIVTNQQNSMNRSGPNKYKGIKWHKRSQKWEAGITFDGHYYFLGSYSDQEEAAKAYNYWAKQLHGEFAYLNDVDMTGFVPKPVKGINKDQTSKFKGIYWNKRTKKWMARIYHKGKHHFIGLYDSEVEAVMAYNQKAIDLIGEDAIINEFE